MEWLQDWWLVYRTEDEMRHLALRAGFEEEKVRTKIDPTGNLVLLKIET